MAHVLGDDDELLIGAQLAGFQLTCMVHLNHNMLSEVHGAYFVPDLIDTVLAGAIDRNTDPDVSFVDMSLADARAWIEHGLSQPLIATGAWLDCVALIKWLITHLPEGGMKYHRPEWKWAALSELLVEFFSSRCGSRFNRFENEELLAELIDSGTGDPLRWSPARIAQVLKGSPFDGEHIPLKNLLEVPELLRAFIPFAHEQSGVRAELTLDTLAAIDERASDYKRDVIEEREFWGEDVEGYVV